jgi:hypothetical protein
VQDNDEIEENVHFQLSSTSGVEWRSLRGPDARILGAEEGT